MTKKRLVLILGGARSGKSEYAQQLAEQHGDKVLYLATATAGDDEMKTRIVTHRSGRPAHWRTLEAPLKIASALEVAIGDAEVVLLDCLTLLVSNITIRAGDEPNTSVVEQEVRAEVEALLAVWASHDATLIIVSNEVGMGIVPAYPLGRLYRDALGRANQWLATRADEVILLIAGLPVELKGLSLGSHE